MKTHLVKDLTELLAKAMAELNSISARPWRVEQATDLKSVLVVLRAERNERRAELRRVVDRLLYTLQVRHGARFTEPLRLKIEDIYATAVARFDEHTERILNG